MPRSKKSPPPSYPWQHPTLLALATALGVTVRTCEHWRGKGAPIPPAPPFDELAVRLWRCTQADDKKTAQLAAPGAALATYCALADQVRTGRKDAEKESRTNPAELVKRRTAEKLQIANDRAKDVMRQQARDCFLGLLGRLRQQLDMRLGGQLAADCWAKAQTDRLASEPLIRTAILSAAATAVNEALAAAQEGAA